MSGAPPNFPTNIEIAQKTFEDWDGVMDVPKVSTCAPKSGVEVVTVCDRAVGEGYTIRARGIMH